MLTRLYVDNFRALIKCELTLGRRSLLIGANGTGKSTFGDVLHRLKWLLLGQSKTDDIFPVDTLTRWQGVLLQTFEIDASGPAGHYRYELVVEHRSPASTEIPRTRIIHEVLSLDSSPLFEFKAGMVQLFRDDHSAGPQYPFDWSRSALGTITPREDNRKLSWFVRWLQDLTIVRPNPTAMEDLFDRDDFFLFPDGRNFAAWYHAASSGDKVRDRALHDTLTDILPGFDALNFEPAGPGRWLLRADFSHPGGTLRLRLTELSDGQRALILLYAVLHFLLDAGRTVVLDEPDNFVSLHEIQPWLLTATDTVDAGTGQLVLVSHHPEIFNQWAVGHGLVTDRDGCGAVRISRFRTTPGTDLSPGEAVARGWTSTTANSPSRLTGS
jgi:hypothetical protein